MPKFSAGILLYRRTRHQLEVFLVHPGGPLWTRKDSGAWSIPKGEYLAGEEPLAAAKREFEEETGSRLAEGEFVPLGQVKQASGKIVFAWALEGDCRAEQIVSNLFDLEWPPKSGRLQQFPEVDRAAWFDLAQARLKINPAQAEFLTRLESLLMSV